MTIADNYLQVTLALFKKQKALAEAAFAQMDDAEFYRQVDAEANSIATIIQHMVGNMRSRWTDFLTTDGEKPDRQRDSEFEVSELGRTQLMQLWEEGWSVLFAAIEPLKPDDLDRIITIRQQPHSVLEAIARQLDHYAQHVGQIIYLAKHYRGADWQSLSIPKKRNEATT